MPQAPSSGVDQQTRPVSSRHEDSSDVPAPSTDPEATAQASTTETSTYADWRPDPYGRAELRRFFLGSPTSLVRDGTAERYDPISPTFEQVDVSIGQPSTDPDEDSPSRRSEAVDTLPHTTPGADVQEALEMVAARVAATIAEEIDELLAVARALDESAPERDSSPVPGQAPDMPSSPMPLTPSPPPAPPVASAPPPRPTPPASPVASAPPPPPPPKPVVTSTTPPPPPPKPPVASAPPPPPPPKPVVTSTTPPPPPPKPPVASAPPPPPPPKPVVTSTTPPPPPPKPPVASAPPPPPPPKPVVTSTTPPPPPPKPPVASAPPPPPPPKPVVESTVAPPTRPTSPAPRVAPTMPSPQNQAQGASTVPAPSRPEASENVASEPKGVSSKIGPGSNPIDPKQQHDVPKILLGAASNLWRRLRGDDRRHP